MSELDKFKKLAESQKREGAKIEGKLETLYEGLGKDGFTSLDSAKGDMILLGKKLNRMRKVFDDKVNQFKDKHAHELSQTD